MAESKNTKPQPPDGEGHGHEDDSEEASEPYEYTPLPDPQPASPGQDPLLVPSTLWTRLVTIHLGEYDDDIAVDLSVVALEETAESQLRDKRTAKTDYRVSAAPHLEQYEALSYVWGSPASPSHVVVVGDEGQGRRIPITRNLDVAMRHLRYLDRPRVLWIDALCIDQASPSDKSRQVGYMNHIFWSTPRVVVWLGPEADDSDHAVNTIKSIGTKIQIDWTTEKISGVTEEDEAVWGGRRGLDDLPLDERDWAAIWLLARRPWFERIWVRQEVHWAGGEAVVCCGRSRAPFEVFQRGLYRVARFKASTEACLARTVLTPLSFRLQNLRAYVKGARCTDPKDYVYGTLGLLSERQYLAIKPDYSKSLQEIFQHVVLRYINIYASLTVLDACGNDSADCELASSGGNLELPSWVPDWTCGKDQPYFMAIFRHFAHFAAKVECHGDGILRVAGLMKGVIQRFIPLDTTSLRGFSASLRRLVPKDAAGLQYPGGGNLWDAYRIALCGNSFKDRTVPEAAIFLLAERESDDALEAIIHGEEPPEPVGGTRMWPCDNVEYRFGSKVYSSLRTHRFFIAGDGLIGWAPKQARQGDHIAIMLGSDTPMALRPSSTSSSGSQQYEVVGPCYLQGFMFGEGYLGPLPEGIRPVVQYEDGRQYMKFLDTASGESVRRDPRLDAFLGRDQARAWQYWETAQTSCFRAEVEDLRSVGFDIQYFDLV